MEPLILLYTVNSRTQTTSFSLTLITPLSTNLGWSGHFTTELTLVLATPRILRKRKTTSTNRWEIADIRTGLSPKLTKPSNNLNHHNRTRMIILLFKLVMRLFLTSQVSPKVLRTLTSPLVFSTAFKPINTLRGKLVHVKVTPPPRKNSAIFLQFNWYSSRLWWILCSTGWIIYINMSEDYIGNTEHFII